MLCETLGPTWPSAYLGLPVKIWRHGQKYLLWEKWKVKLAKTNFRFGVVARENSRRIRKE